MNKELTNQIVNHVFSNLGLIENGKTSLMNDDLLTDLKIEWTNEDDEGQEFTDIAKVWAAETDIDGVKVKMGCTEFKTAVDLTEIVAIIEIEKCPKYGCHLEVLNKYTNDNIKIEGSTILLSIKDSIWVPTDIFTQASFLAGMEKFKDLMAVFVPCKNTKLIYDALISIINWTDDNNEKY